MGLSSPSILAIRPLAVATPRTGQRAAPQWFLGYAGGIWNAVAAIDRIATRRGGWGTRARNGAVNDPNVSVDPPAAQQIGNPKIPIGTGIRRSLEQRFNPYEIFTKRKKSSTPSCGIFGKGVPCFYVAPSHPSPQTGAMSVSPRSSPRPRAFSCSQTYSRIIEPSAAS